MGEIAQQVAIVVCFSWPVSPGQRWLLDFWSCGSVEPERRRRSPIGIDLLRGPGHTLREQLDDAATDVMGDIFALMLVPLLLLCTFLAQGHIRGLQGVMHLAPIYVVFVIGVIAFTVRKLLKAGERLDNLKAGFDAELAVGQELDQLMRQGAAVFHDIPADNFNIDHVVISSEGVFAVETKGFTKPKQGNGKAAATSQNGKSASVSSMECPMSHSLGNL